MKYIYKFYILLPVATFIISFIACSTIDNNYIASISNDFTTEGFITGDIFQCIITEYPDQNIKTLVYRRQCSELKLKQNLHKKSIDKLYEMFFKDISKNKVNLKNDLQQIIKKRVIVFTYYNNDDSITAIVRLYSPDFKKKIDNLKNNLSKEENKNEKSK